jgi:hypothetical protein
MSLRTFSILSVATLAACNGLAGISDFHDMDPNAALDSGRGGGSDSGDGAAPGADGADAGAVDVVGVDAADTAPPGACDSALLSLQITVIASVSGVYSGVEIHLPLGPGGDSLGNISPGDTRTICAAPQTEIDLRGTPNDNKALHRWDGTSCGTASRCDFFITVPVVATVHLQ